MIQQTQTRFILTSLLVLGLLSLATAEEVCPPPEVFSPCICLDSTRTIICYGIQENFNLKQIFDDASALINDDVVFVQLFISENTQLVEFEEGAIQHLKFEKITINRNPNLVYISPNAFDASRNVTKVMELDKNHIRNDAPYETDIFEFVKGFKELRSLSITENRLSSIPSNAFHDLNSLYEVYLNHNNISHVGSRAFSQAPNLNRLKLPYNSMPSGGLLEDAFEGISSSAEIDLSFNDGMLFMEQKSYQPLLEGAAFVDIGGWSCTPDGVCSFRRFHCDERANWLCDNRESYEDVLGGFLCFYESGYENIWKYCEGNNPNNSTIL